MSPKHTRLLWLIITCLMIIGPRTKAQDPIRITSPMSPPAWAFLEREVLDASSAAVRDFYNHYFDERGYLLHVARWGALDGTDDAIEHFKNWTILHSSPAFVARRRRGPWMEGLRRRPPEAYPWRYVEEADRA